MSTLSPEQAAIVERLISTAAQASAVLGLPLVSAELFVRNAYEFLATNNGRFGDQPFLLALKASDDTMAKLMPQTVVTNINAGRPIFYVDAELNVIKTETGEAQLSSHCAHSKNQDLFGLIVYGTYVFEVIQGTLVGETWISGEEQTAPVISSFHHPVEQFKSLVSDHLNEVLNADQVRIWNDKGKRILRSAPEKTELIFHESLFFWLDRYVSPKLKVYAEPMGLGQDKTDINIVTTAGTVVVEVKWLGVNQSGDEYKQTRINEGLAQVTIYLNNDKDLICGHLVCYDARSKAAHDNESTWNDSFRHSLCTDPLIPFLSTDQPSKLAKSIVKGKAS